MPKRAGFFKADGAPTAGNAIREHKREKSRNKLWMFIIICIMKYIETTAFHLEGRNNRCYDKKP